MENKIKGNQLPVCCILVGRAYGHVSCDVDVFLSASYLIMFFPLWPAGGVLHFHPDNVCSEDRDKVSMKHDQCLLPPLCCWFEKDLFAIVFLFILPLLSVLFLFSPPTNCTPGSPSSFTSVQMEDSPSPKRQRLSQQSMLDLSSAPPSTPSSPIRPWELPPSRRPHPHYMPERCHTPLRNRRR